MKYSCDGENSIFLFEHSKLNCFCIISKSKQFNLPGLGGTRFIGYPDLATAITTATALSKSMLFKNRIAKLPFTGAKQIIFSTENNISKQKRNDILAYSAECVNSLKGEFITGTDMGLTAEDVNFMATISPYILHGEAGNTSYNTAIGVMEGLINIIKMVLPSKPTSDLQVVVQGVGKVGAHIVELLKQQGMQVAISDIDREKGLKISDLHKAAFLPQITQLKCDIFMPCAIENSVNFSLMKSLGASIIAGCANNQLNHSEDDLILSANGIFYAPDFVINSGGTIHAAASYLRWSTDKLIEKIKLIPQQLKEIYHYSTKNKIGTQQAAREYVLASLDQ